MQTSSLEIRQATRADIAAIAALASRAKEGPLRLSSGMISGQISAFPEGCIVAILEGAIVGYAASTQVHEATLSARHSWSSVSGGGYGGLHAASGDWLYALATRVDPALRRLRIKERFFKARQHLCCALGLKGVAHAARLSGFNRLKARYATPQAYLEAVKAGEIGDHSVGFAMGRDFEPLFSLPDYWPADRAVAPTRDEGGHAALMIWRNKTHDADARAKSAARREPNLVRVAAVQMAARPVDEPEDFYRRVAYFAKVAADYGADFVTFPEYVSLQLLSGDPKRPAKDAIARLADHTPDFKARLREIAMAHNINIVGGSHPALADGQLRNVAFVFLRDGTVAAREKLHPTPDERAEWGVSGGSDVGVIETDCGPIGVSICYDAEFPEVVRRLADEGARLLFVPYFTDTRHGHLRVRYCAQARAIENQIYVVTAGMIGAFETVPNADILYAQSAILTPCDIPFARDGIAAEASENVEAVIFADLDLAILDQARAEGAVRNLRDRRGDLYRTVWSDGG
ncbi:MAG: carbon-nitrogen hydrolase family protein [Pseudomonadota bacterium]